jgi:DNA invertase Pin-like site-specific DNA recombinase
MSTSLIRRSAPDTSAERTAWQKAESRITETVDRLSAQLQLVSQTVETLERKLTELEAVVAPIAAASTTGHNDERTIGLASRFRRKVIALVREVFVGGLEKLQQETNREKLYMTLDR